MEIIPVSRMEQVLERSERFAPSRRLMARAPGLKPHRIGAVSSVGRASPLHGEGRGFEPCTAHHAPPRHTDARPERRVRLSPLRLRACRDRIPPSFYVVLRSPIVIETGLGGEVRVLPNALAGVCLTFCGLAVAQGQSVVPEDFFANRPAFSLPEQAARMPATCETVKPQLPSTVPADARGLTLSASRHNPNPAEAEAFSRPARV
jgi:hypothetical protein